MRVAIVGLGRIGAAQSDAGGVPRTHLSAALAVPSVTIAALVDPDAGRLGYASEFAPDASLHASVGTLAPGSIDLLVDARPPVDRANMVRVAAALGARAIVLEKPLASDADEASLVHAAVEETGLTARVMFHRRFDAGHREAFARMGEAPIGAIGVYGKGLLNYGSHLVDLLVERLGRVGFARGEGWDAGDDPAPGFDLRFEHGGAASIRTVPDARFDVFEVTFFGHESRLDLINGGATRRLSMKRSDYIYPGYAHLEMVQEHVGPVGGFVELYEAAARDLGPALPGASVGDALHGMRVIEAVRRSARGDGGWIALTT